MYNYLRSFFTTRQDWQDTCTTIQQDLEQLKEMLVSLDGLFYQQLSRETMNDIDDVCADIDQKIKTIQTTTIQIKNSHPKDDNDRVLKNTKVFEISTELQKISNDYRTKQYDYLCKTTL